MNILTEIVKKHELYRQGCINLQASENILSSHVREALSSDLASRYSHVMNSGYNGYGGSKFSEEILSATENVIKTLYKVKYAEVRTIGGHVAAEVAILSTMSRKENMLAIGEESGGYTGYFGNYIPLMFSINSYKIPYDIESQEIDYEKMEKIAKHVNPSVILLGQSFFVKPYDLKRVREIADENSSKIIYDGSHVMGLIAGEKFQPDVMKYSDILLGSTHKTFFGPQGGIALTDDQELSEKMAFNTVWKTMDNYHLNRVAALGEAAEEMIHFGVEYASQVCKNSLQLGNELEKNEIRVKYSPWFSFSHQIHLSPLNNNKFGSFLEISKKLEDNGIIVDREGRIGTAEITRMGIDDMKEIGSKIAEALNGKDVREDVKRITSEMKMKYTW
ncbi:MAG: PLP-dependent aminotransferase family protein [Thermoplasmataceae archaeon]